MKKKIGVVLLFIGSLSGILLLFINVKQLEFPGFMNQNNILMLSAKLFELQLLENSDPWKQILKNN